MTADELSSGNAAAEADPATLQALCDVLPIAKQETAEGDDALWVVADLLEPIDPDTVQLDLVLTDAALLLFGEVGFGPSGKSLPWLRYAQRTTTQMLGPSDPLTCWANTAAARLCDRLGRYEEAASAWDAAATAHTDQGQWQEANECLVRQAKCLYRIGRCADAIVLARQAWQRCAAEASSGIFAWEPLLVCAEMLRLCGRRDEARLMWSELLDRFANSWCFDPDWVQVRMDHYEGPVSAPVHWPVCSLRRKQAAAGERPGAGQGPGITSGTLPTVDPRDDREHVV
jgi:tetratricopeptide (TPR) repeat protein